MCIFPLIVGIANIPTNILNATVCNKMNQKLVFTQLEVISMSKDCSISLDTQRTIWQPIYLKNLFGVNSSVVLNSMDDIFILKNLLYSHFFCSSSLKVYLSQSYITELLSIRPLPVVPVLIFFKIRLYLVNQNCNSMTASQVRHKSQTLLYKNNIRQFAALTGLETVGYFSCRTVFGTYLLQQLIKSVILPLEGLLDTQCGVVWKAYIRKCFASVDEKAVLEEGRRDHYLTLFDQSNVICCLYFTVQGLNVTE